MFAFQVIICKYHSTFLTTSGIVFTCGNGHGGRLGHGDQQTCLVSASKERPRDRLNVFRCEILLVFEVHIEWIFVKKILKLIFCKSPYCFIFSVTVFTPNAVKQQPGLGIQTS